MQIGRWHYKVGYLGFRVTRLYHWKVRKLKFLEELNCSCLGLAQQTHNLSFPLKHKCSLLINFDHITRIESLPTTSTRPSSHSLVMIGQSETAPTSSAPCRMDDIWTEKLFFFQCIHVLIVNHGGQLCANRPHVSSIYQPSSQSPSALMYLPTYIVTTCTYSTFLPMILTCLHLSSYLGRRRQKLEGLQERLPR